MVCIVGFLHNCFRVSPKFQVVVSDICLINMFALHMYHMCLTLLILWHYLMIPSAKPLHSLYTKRFLKRLYNRGPLHVLWQVSFGCLVTWSISSWQEYYKSVFFFNFTKLQYLNDKIIPKKTIWHLTNWQNWCFG